MENIATKAELYQGLVDESSTAVVSIEKKERKILFANNAWKRQEGIPVETNVVGMNLEQLIVEDKIFFTEEEIEKLPQDTYQKFHKKSSLGMPINVNARSIQWDGEDAYVCYSNDESELWNNRVMLSEALKTAQVLTWKYDFKNNRLSTTGTFGEQYRMPPVLEDFPECLIENGFVHKDSVSALREALIKVSEGKRVSLDLRCKSVNGLEYIWNKIIYTPVFDVNGICIEAIGTSVDITERKEQENRYLKQIQSMADVDDENLIAKGRHNLTTNRIEFYRSKSEGALHLAMDSTYDEAVELLSESAVHDIDKKRIQASLNREKVLQEFMNGVAEGSIDYQRKLPKREIGWISTRYSLFTEPDTGEIIEFVYSYDITDRMVDKMILDKLSSIEYDALGLFDVRTNQYVLHDIMSELEKPVIIGHGNYDERVRLRLSEILVDEKKEEIIKLFYISNVVKQLEKQDVYEIIYAIKAQNDIRYKKMRFCYLDETKTNVLYCRCDVTDIYLKEKKQIQVIEEALKNAREANKAKTEFLSRMSHDIRTPMNTIVNLTQIVKSEIEDHEKAIEDLNKIDKANHFLLDLINDILDMSKIEQKNIKLNPEYYGRDEFLEYIESTFVPLAEEKKIQFEILNEAKNLDVLIDKVRFNQICFNLLSNAIKYTPEGGHVTFKMIHGEQRNGKIACDIYVIDNGIGMSKEFQKKMFDPFMQEGRDYRTVEGTGLGLSIVKEFVELMNGTIDVVSEINQGSTFHFHIDMLLGKVENEENCSSVQKVDMLKLIGLQILLVEDHPLNQEIARRLLEKAGMTVAVVPNGLEAVNEIRRHAERYDCILMDMRMPVMDGLEATKCIRKLEDPKARTVPIIAMTANAFVEDYEKSMAVGMNGYVAKPINPTTMYLTIQQNIRR